VAVNLREELSRRELPVDHVGLEFGHVHAVGRESAERLEERGGDVADAEHERRDHWATGCRNTEVAGQHHEPGGVVVGVLDALGEHIETVDLRGHRRAERRLRRVAGLGDLPGGAGGIARDDGDEAVLADDPAALAERVDVAADRAQPAQGRAGHAKQVEPDPEEVLGDDVQRRVRQQVVNVRDPAGA
jgi:hypothetical protein